MIQNERNKLSKLANNFTEMARRYGVAFQVQFNSLPKVKNLMDNLIFLKRNGLLSSVEHDIEELQEFIQETQNIADKYRGGDKIDFDELTNIARFNELVKRRYERNFRSLAKTLCNILDEIKSRE